MSQDRSKSRILVCAGSARADSVHRRLARLAEAALAAEGADATYVEIGNYDLPIYNQDVEEAQGLPPAVPELRELLITHAGLALASPEYNGSYSPLLKNTIDWISRPVAGERHSSAFKGKVAGLLSATPGPSGGRAGLMKLHELLVWLGMDVIQDQINIPYSSRTLDSDGNLVRETDVVAMQLWAQQLVFEARHPATQKSRIDTHQES